VYKLYLKNVRREQFGTETIAQELKKMINEADKQGLLNIKKGLNAIGMRSNVKTRTV
jgi:hypothetical protein